MVRAILEGRKTMTRRVMTPFKSRLEIGDILYIREEHYRYGTWNEVPGVKTKGGRQKWEFVPLTDEVRYFDNPPEEFKKGRHHKLAQFPGWYKRLARFMPKANARNFIQVTDLRAEKLGDISVSDAVNEGVEYWNIDYERLEGGELVADYKNYEWKDDPTYPDYHFPTYADPISSFQSLWRYINGDWNPDQWVWVYSFKRIEKPE
jgi:hypothetical protein